MQTKPAQTDKVEVYGRVGLRRMLAFIVDWFVIALYAGIVFGVTILVHGGTPSLSAPYNAFAGQLIGFVSLTLPVLLYFVLCEYRFGRTLGKRLLGLQVIGKAGGRPPLAALFKRNVLKFLPWEMAHYTVHQFTAANLAHQNPQLSVYVILALLYTLAGLYLIGIFSKKGPLYDRVAGTRVGLIGSIQKS